MGKIVLSGHILVPDADLICVRDALPLHCELTLAEPGCLVFRVNEDLNQLGKFAVYEEFINREAFETHQARVAASEWGKVSQSAERFYSIEEIDQ